MELSYLRRLDLRTAGRVDFGERTRPAGWFDDEREALERATNALDDLAQDPGLGAEACLVIAMAVRELIHAGY